MAETVNLAALIARLPAGTTVRGDAASRAIAAVESDSRRVVPGALFVALRGEHADGHAFVAQAIAAGAAAVVVEAPPALLPSQTVLVAVADTRRALSSLAAAFYGDPSHALDVVGVTGTNGKTTTVHMLRGILEQAGVPTGTMRPSASITLASRCGWMVPTVDTRRSIGASIVVWKLTGLVSVMP